MRPDGEIVLLDVADVRPRAGCALEAASGPNLWLPARELPAMTSLWPQAGDRVYAVRFSDKHGRMSVRAATEADLAPLATPAPADWKNRWLESRVYNSLEFGTFVVCKDGEDDSGFGAIGFIHRSERVRLLRMGEQVRARVSFVREDGRINLSMRPLKEHGRDEDAEKILGWLRETPKGAMPYSDQTPADRIQSKFNISKSAFKRALGKLMKEGIVVQEGNWTRLSDGRESGPGEGGK